MTLNLFDVRDDIADGPEPRNFDEFFRNRREWIEDHLCCAHGDGIEMSDIYLSHHLETIIYIKGVPKYQFRDRIERVIF